MKRRVAEPRIFIFFSHEIVSERRIFCIFRRKRCWSLAVFFSWRAINRSRESTAFAICCWVSRSRSLVVSVMIGSAVVRGNCRPHKKQKRPVNDTPRHQAPLKARNRIVISKPVPNKKCAQHRCCVHIEDLTPIPTVPMLFSNQDKILAVFDGDVPPSNFHSSQGSTRASVLSETPAPYHDIKSTRNPGKSQSRKGAQESTTHMDSKIADKSLKKTFSPCISGL